MKGSTSLDGLFSVAGGGEAPACAQDVTEGELTPMSTSESSEAKVTTVNEAQSVSPFGTDMNAQGDGILSPDKENPKSENKADENHATEEKKQKQNAMINDEFNRLLTQDDARLLIDLLKLAVTGKC